MSTSAPKARVVDALTGAKAPTEFFRALDDATRQAAETALAREVFGAAVGDYDCPCGSSYEFCEDSTLEEYGGLHRWLGRHESCTALLCRVDELTDELVGLRDAHQITLGLLAAARQERDTYRAAASAVTR